MEFPGSLNARVQVPTRTKLTVPEMNVHTALVADVMTTMSPDVADAVGEYVAPPVTALDGATEVTVMEFAVVPPKEDADAPHVQFTKLAPSPHVCEHVFVKVTPPPGG